MRIIIESMSEPEKQSDIPRKWCPVCRKWKTAIVFTAETIGTESVKKSREITYCPQCGAKLRVTNV
jgi:hypothetical protein